MLEGKKTAILGDRDGIPGPDMSNKLKIVHYLNQFFGQIGGEDKAGIPPRREDGPIGPGAALNNSLGEDAEIVNTIICGDTFFNENLEESKSEIKKMLKAINPDLLIAGPAFNAGRYGVACGTVAEIAKTELGIDVVSGIYPENPGYEMFKQYAYFVETSDSAAGMRSAIPDMIKIVKSYIDKNGELGSPEEEGYMPRGIRKNIFAEERGAARAIKMMLKKLEGEDFETEYPMPVFDRVDPVDPIKDMPKTKVALVTSGGIVPKGNPDHIESSSASKYGEYSLEGVMDLDEENYETAHGGYDPVCANKDADRVLPVDVMRDLEKEGVIGELHNKFYTTVGNGTSVANAKAYAQEIAENLLADGVQAVILTST
ncbi:glycine reductase [Halanaerobium congolense]|uniref:Glycine reductase n=1 Tax=Halanaerobium congolense TaxID=54121 RepID=A0A4R8GDV0_9FIRM|nr:glycine reductase [Halanaerobium congolense]